MQPGLAIQLGMVMQPGIATQPGMAILARREHPIARKLLCFHLDGLKQQQLNRSGKVIFWGRISI